jgi:probable F420-dependent oxidoreductase
MEPRLGLTLPVQHFFPLPTLFDIAQRAEAAAYDSLWLPEVVGPDAYSVLTAIALKTQRVILASGVIPLQIRTPVTHAYSIATLNMIAPGRAMLGIGTSSPLIVGAWHGQPYEKPLKQMREAVAIMRQVHAGQKTDFKGEIYSSTGFRMGLLPAAIPIIVGALNLGMLRLAGEIADGVLLNWVPAHAIPEMVAAVREGATKAGRNPDDVDICCYVRTCVTSDPSATVAALRRELTPYCMVPTYRRQFDRAGYAAEAAAAEEKWRAGDRSGAIECLSERMVNEINAIGDAADCEKKLQAFRDAGVTHLVVAPWSGGADPLAECLATLEAFTPA